MPDARKDRPGFSRFRIWVEENTITLLPDLKSFYNLDTSRVFGLGLHFLNVIAMEKARGRRIVSMNPDGTDVKDIY